MKFSSIIAFCVLATSAYGGVMRPAYVGNENAGSYAGQQVAPAPAPAKAPAPAPAPYTAPAPAPAPASPDMHDEKCWMETKKCCWVEKEDGYECRDNYDTKMARCYMKYKYDKKCDKAEKHGQVEKPKERIEYGKCMKVHYDQNYGPHVAGYPSGMSETYDTKELPTTPYKVDAAPHAPYTAPAAPAGGNSYEQNTNNAGNGNNGYRAY